MIKGLLLIALLAGYTLAALDNKCGCCPKWCDCECKEAKRPGLEIGLAQDSSGSIDDDEWILSKTVLAAIVCGIKCPGNKVAHISFSTGVQLDWNLNSPIGINFHQTLINVIGLDQFQEGGTNIVGGIQRLLSEVFDGSDSPDAPNLALVITDGMGNVNHTSLSDVASQLHLIAKTVVIGVSDQIDVAELATIASGPGNNNVFTASSMEDLPQLIPAVITTITDMFPCEPEREDCVCCCPPPEAFPKPHYFGKMFGDDHHGSGHGYGGYGRWA